MKRYAFLLVALVLFCESLIQGLFQTAKMQRLHEEIVTDMGFRDQEIGEELLSYMNRSECDPAEIGVYLLETKFGYQGFEYPMNEKSFEHLKKKWRGSKNWNSYEAFLNSIWGDLTYFPIPTSTTDSSLGVSFSDSWMSERSYGGKRGHEGTDIMAQKSVAGVYPILSITDGVVEQKGWLEKGGYRLGIRAPSGAYFYYAHLDSYANLEVGDSVKAGQLLGFMGDTGYGKEGTRGQFPVHLHLGIYIYPNGEELSVNPYWILRYLQKHTRKCAYSCGDIQ